MKLSKLDLDVVQNTVGTQVWIKTREIAWKHLDWENKLIISNQVWSKIRNPVHDQIEPMQVIVFQNTREISLTPS